MPANVAAVFAAFPDAAQPGCRALRDLIFAVAAETPQAGPIAEELRWGQPAYLTPQTGSGTTIRIGVPKSGGFALFLHCRTSLIEDFRPLAPEGTRFDGTRAVLFDDDDSPDRDALALLIRAALTYHLRGS